MAGMTIAGEKGEGWNPQGMRVDAGVSLMGAQVS